VNLTVYNTLGQVVETIVSGELSAGVHQHIWNAGRMPSGAYIYRINAGKYSAVKRMLLVK
jgi:flagellar hook assembly protein FlgD